LSNQQYVIFLAENVLLGSLLDKKQYILPKRQLISTSLQGITFQKNITYFLLNGWKHTIRFANQPIHKQPIKEKQPTSSMELSTIREATSC
jgi:hypothetical protein